MSKIHMMTIYQVKEDKIDGVRLAVSEFIEAVKEKEPGTLFYESYQGKGDLSFFHLMTFENKVAEELHRKTPHMTAFELKLYPNCEDEPGMVELELVGSNVR
jgi:quinol monooxygenase YgiN